MGLKIKNVKLDKEKYVYWIDKNINLSFELYSDKDQTIKNIYIYYWYDFLLNTVFKDKFIEKNISISSWDSKEFSFVIPIKFFNFNDWQIKVENYINISVYSDLFGSKIRKSLSPNITFDEKLYDFSNLFLTENILDTYSLEYKDDNTKEYNISSKLNNTEDFILIKRKFKGVLIWFLTYFNYFSEYLNEDYIHKDIYNKLKENIIVNLFDKLINSKIYCFIYKYIYILFFMGISWIDITINDYSFIFYLLIFISLLFIWFSRLLEKLFHYELKKSFYDIKQLSSDNIKNNIEQKLISWSLKITDIFDNFSLKLNDSNIDYNFTIFLSLNIWTYTYTIWTNNSKKVYLNSKVYSIELFNYAWKGYFDLSKIHLLENNYNKLSGILPKSNTNPKTKVYYTLAYKCKSKHIPDMDGEMDLYLNFNK